MNRRLFLGTFANDHDVVEATAAARARGMRIVDVYTPYPVHGLDEAMGLPPSRLSRVCLACGLLGVALAMWFQMWTSAVDWPINVGGRPWNSWPAFIPVTFEVMVLLAGFGVVFAFFAVSRMFPGKKALLPAPGITGDRFVLVVEESDAAFDAPAVRRLFQDHHALRTEEREESDAHAAREGLRPEARRRLNIALSVGVCILLALNWILGRDPSQPNDQFLPEMVDAVPYPAFAANPNLPDGKTLQAAPEGTIPRGHLPLHYKNTPEDAKRAGEELKNPYPPDHAVIKKQGAILYGNYCAVCHGLAGDGKGPMTERAERVLPPTSLVADKTKVLKDGQLFHVVSFGQGKMAPYAGQLSREARWSIVGYVRSLQKQGGGMGP
jgi:mono/diheme cytochrome c family protein